MCVSHLTGDAYTGWPSQNFEPDLDAADSIAADDLQVSRRCRARALTVVGSYNDAYGPPRSETVTFYRYKPDRPGRVLSSQTIVGEDESFSGTFEITLDDAVLLRPGRSYWISVQANMDYFTAGMWFWELRTIFDGEQPIWEKPGDEYSTGCVDWTLVETCSRGQQHGDFMYEVRTK